MSVTSVDVLIPYFNDADGFRQTLASIERQSAVSQLELVVADDGSTPEQAKRLRVMLGGTDLPYRLMTNGQNRGRPYTRNVLLDNMAGDYVAWLDSGDEWFDGKIAAQLAALAQAGADQHSTDIWATCNYEWREARKTPRSVTQQTDGDHVRALLGDKMRAYLWTILAPRRAMQAVGYFDTSLPRLQDLDFFLRFTIGGGRIVKPQDPEPLCVYNKDHSGRNAAEIDSCYDILFDKYANAYRRFGRKFEMQCRRNAKKNAWKFATANGQIDLADKLKRQRRAIKVNYYLGTLNPLSPIKRLIRPE